MENWYIVDYVALSLEKFTLLGNGRGYFRQHFVRWFVRKDDDQRVGVGDLDGVAVIDIEPIAAIAQSF